MASYSDRNTAGTIRRFGRPDPNSAPATLGNLIDNEQFVFPRCMACQTNGAPVDPRPIANKHGRHRTVLELKNSLLCTNCGARRRAEISLDFPPGWNHVASGSRPYAWWDEHGRFGTEYENRRRQR